MKIGVIGVGRLGLCFALNLDYFGHEVIATDIDSKLISELKKKNTKSFEPNVAELLKKSQVFFSEKIDDLMNCEVIFILANTPSLLNGEFDHSQIISIFQSLICYSGLVVISSTVMPGFCNTIDFPRIVYNPQFVAQGSVIENQKKPDLILIGYKNIEDANLIESIYKNICLNNPNFIKISLLESEITKLAINCFVTTKISFANAIGDFCKKCGANENKVLSAISSDSRIGDKCFKYGYGYGGPCFPRDNKAMIAASMNFNSSSDIPIATDNANKNHLENMISNYFDGLLPFNVENDGDIVIIKCLSYKLGSFLIEESQPLKFALEVAKTKKVFIKDEYHVCEKIKEIHGDKFGYIPL